MKKLTWGSKIEHFDWFDESIKPIFVGVSINSTNFIFNIDENPLADKFPDNII